MARKRKKAEEEIAESQTLDSVVEPAEPAEPAIEPKAEEPKAEEPKAELKRKPITKAKELMTKEYSEAMAWMTELHEGDVDKAGVPYWMHPMMVSLRVKSLAAKGGFDEQTAVIAALLHDTVEDGKTSIASIRRQFGPEVAAAVAILTRDPKMTYMEYIARVVASGSRVAWAVKWADIIHNTNPKRLAKLKEADRNRLVKKYGNARKLLEKAWPFLKQEGEDINLKRKEA